MQNDRTVRSENLRSVFVGNIPYDATEEKLRDIFSAVGPVLSFRIVFDRETGKPKGYGFCEYKDQETATSAIRNLNGRDLGGRQLRVDSATNERKEELEEAAPAQQQQQQQPQTQQPAPVADPIISQNVISSTLSSLPPEQLFELCKQMKASLLVNPNETRQLLVQNPQLAYALIQVLVMVNAIDPQTAFNTLHAPMMPMMAPSTPMVIQQPQLVVQPPVMPFTYSPMVGPSVPNLPAAPTSVPNIPAAPANVPSIPAAAAGDPRLARRNAGARNIGRIN